MLAVSSGEVGPIVSGIVYCAVILECMQLFDLARASEWTAALDGWCRAQPDLVPFRGQCLVHQSQLRQAAGDWPEVVATVTAAFDRLTDPPHPALGLAYYQEGELCRLRGGAAAAGRTAGQRRRLPADARFGAPELQRGDAGSAAASIGRALGEASQPFNGPLSSPQRSRSCSLPATLPPLDGSAELSIAIGAGSHCPERWPRIPWERSCSRRARHRRHRAPAGGRHAWHGPACRTTLPGARCGSASAASLGRPPPRRWSSTTPARRSNRLEQTPTWQALRAARLGAVHPSDQGCAVSPGAGGPAPVAAGKTNREIAPALTISQHTVRRHLENTFAKLGVTSRAAATASPTSTTCCDRGRDEGHLPHRSVPAEMGHPGDVGRRGRSYGARHDQPHGGPL